MIGFDQKAKRGCSMKIFQDFWTWVSGQIIGEVPEADALCEFDCRKLECREGEWESCERRLRRAAGELMPAHKPTPSSPALISTPAQKPSLDMVAAPGLTEAPPTKPMAKSTALPDIIREA